MAENNKKPKSLRTYFRYLYIPIVFLIIGLGVLYLVASPIFKFTKNLYTIISADTVVSDESDMPPLFSLDNSHNVDTEPANSIETSPNIISISDIEWPSYGQQYAQISCERINLNAPVFFGDDKATLRKGVGQYNGSFIFGYGRTILLAGHNTTYFMPLQYIQAGDIVTVQTAYDTYKYKITDTKILNCNDHKAIDLIQKEKEQLVMYTCYPFGTLEAVNDRLFVYGDKISGSDIIEEANND